ncbi:MAG: GNAT family N-acetyltransferase [Actinobacteria bacterium]|jgi:ribosomal protein S18 acetylase RimI-like enzyme|nr:GNAT family N-acetyltransferase [Actinomycetota bacterium]
MRIDTLTDDQVGAALALWAATEHLGPVDPDELAQVRRHDPDLVLGARDDDGRLLGVVIGAWDGRRGSINRLAVAPSARRSGVAQALVKQIEDRLYARGCRRITLLVFAGNEGGREFWRTSAYREFEDVVMFSRDLGTAETRPHGPASIDADPGC